MVYAYDLLAQMPVRDLYDTQMMLASVGYAKDMYEKAALEIKDFKKEYGDFATLIPSQLKWYNENFDVQGFVDDIYRRGGDPLRNSSDRAAIMLYIYSRPYKDFNRIRRNAAIAEEYLKSVDQLKARNKFDEEYEKFRLGGKTLQDLGVNEDWNTSSASPYEPLDVYTEHLWKDMKPEYIRYDPKTGMDYTGVTKERRAKALTEELINDMLKTDLGKYFYEISKLNAAIELGREPSEEEARDRYRRDILSQTSRFDYEIGKENPEYARRRTAALRNNILGGRRASKNNFGSGGGNTKTKPLFDYNDFIIANTAANILGNTSIGAKLGIGGVSDFDPKTVENYIVSAQKELAERYYPGYREEYKFGKNDKYFYNRLREDLFKRTGTTLGDSEGGSIYRQITFPYRYFENLDFKSLSNIPDSYRETYLNYPEIMRDANEKFVSSLSIQSSPSVFANGMRRQNDSENSLYVFMNSSDKDRIFSLDEIALGSAGVDRPDDFEKAKIKTKSIRRHFQKHFADGKTMMISEGYVLGRAEQDGSYNVYLKIRIVNKNSKEENFSLLGNEPSNSKYNNMYKDGDVIYFKMPQNTYPNPTTSVDGLANMDLVITDESFAYDRAALKELGVSNTDIKTDESVPDIYNLWGEYYDDDDLMLEEMGY